MSVLFILAMLLLLYALPHVILRVCEDNNAIRFVDSPFVLERPGVAASFIYLAVEGTIFTLLTLLMEVHIIII